MSPGSRSAGCCAMPTAGPPCAPTPTPCTTPPPWPTTRRWDLPLPSREETLRYMAGVEEQVLERLAHRPHPDDVYFTLLTVFHEDMHARGVHLHPPDARLSRPAPVRHRRRLAGGRGRPVGRRCDGGRRRLPARRGTGGVVRLRQREVGAPGRAAAVRHRPGAGDAGRVRGLRGGRRLPPPRAVGRRGVGLARTDGRGSAGLLAARGGRLAAPRLRPLGRAGAAPAGCPRQLV